jgi:hypothetical protein
MSPGKKTTWNKNDVDALRLTQQLREYHHRALWEEEKHFTWLFNIVLAAQSGILISDIQGRGIALIVLSIIGLVFVSIALKVVRREGVYFVNAHRNFVRRFNIVFPEQKLEESTDNPNKKILFNLLRNMCSRKLSIRDLFQLLFLFFGLIDFIVLCLGVYFAIIFV